VNPAHADARTSDVTQLPLQALDFCRAISSAAAYPTPHNVRIACCCGLSRYQKKTPVRAGGAPL